MVVDSIPAELRDRPTWRGRLHTWAFCAAIPAGILLVLEARSATARAAAAIYGASVLLLFGTSAAYHRLARSPKARRVMRRLDHSMIFVLIAGTYTPVCLLVLPLPWGIPVLALVTTGAIAGLVVKLIAFDRLRFLAVALYPALGWTAIVAAPVLVGRLTPWQLTLMIVGGVLYTVGIPVLVLERPDPWPRTFGYHEVWHAFTVVAGACHFASVGLIIATP